MDPDPLGPRLKLARETRGLSLREIANSTKISMVALRALEDGDFSKLPGGIYSRAFIRAYAAQVGLDPEDTVREFVGELSIQERDASRIRIRPVVSADDRAFLERQQRAMQIFRVVAVVGGALLLALVVWLIWTWWPGRGQTAVALPPEPAPARQPAPPPPPADPFPARTDAEEAPGREQLTVGFEVSGACWVQVTADGQVVYSRLMQAGERETLRASREMVLDVGNAGVFNWTINGRPAQTLGSEGRRRQITVTRETAQSFMR